MEIIIFFDTGETYMFEQVENLEVSIDGREVSFTYFGKATQKQRHAKFNNVSGYAIT